MKFKKDKGIKSKDNKPKDKAKEEKDSVNSKKLKNNENPFMSNALLMNWVEVKEDGNKPNDLITKESERVPEKRKTRKGKGPEIDLDILDPTQELLPPEILAMIHAKDPMNDLTDQLLSMRLEKTKDVEKIMDRNQWTFVLGLDKEAFFDPSKHYVHNSAAMKLVPRQARFVMLFRVELPC